MLFCAVRSRERMGQIDQGAAPVTGRELFQSFPGFDLERQAPPWRPYRTHSAHHDRCRDNRFVCFRCEQRGFPFAGSITKVSVETQYVVSKYLPIVETQYVVSTGPLIPVSWLKVAFLFRAKKRHKSVRLKLCVVQNGVEFYNVLIFNVYANLSWK